MRVLVCGGRHFSDRVLLSDTLGVLHTRAAPITCVISGACSGADSIAEAWARFNGIEVNVFPANWMAHGRAAGPIRNQRMLDEGKPDVVVAFDGGRGTADMVLKAKKAGVRVVTIEPRSVPSNGEPRENGT